MNKNPRFKIGPVIRNVSPTTVNVIWEGTLENSECADHFDILFWKTNSINSDRRKLRNKKGNSVLVGVAPNTIYTFQVYVTEVAGTGWNKLCQLVLVKDDWSSEVTITTLNHGKVYLKLSLTDTMYL